jgi:hypothetical protein
MLTHLTRWYGAAEILTMATATNGELLALPGPRNPYPGKLGVIEKGAHADLLVVDGDPLQDIALLAAPATSLKLIMKGGVIYKDALTSKLARTTHRTRGGQPETCASIDAAREGAGAGPCLTPPEPHSFAQFAPRADCPLPNGAPGNRTDRFPPDAVFCWWSDEWRESTQS